MNQPFPSSSQTIIVPSDPDYDYWNGRAANARLQGNPLRIIPVHSTEMLAAALQSTVDAGHRLASRGGGHCLENFVSDSAVEVVIDISQMKGISYGPGFNAIEIKAGVTLGEMYEKLYKDWKNYKL